ncbi:unnamed protein product [Vitrella brassicaformis CCMP3155]|uniref:tyrosine--tRNA ligase n=1 Tax=Vitrella brassicaformis (strain CCMP3155) TaxID=1169540 RepID=A0A0G4FK88_VITBC|nr:unnamed protein product [Vitrella brassicaformis CCMP3155]|eukprot:CEM14201.1 unnamed protein product [Vitrella brassicaformis CCMP3155]
MLNNKLGGDINKIRKTGEYFIEVWKAAGMDMSNVRFLWASDEINKNSNQYWMRVVDIARKFNITRIKRCGQIMGRGEGDDQPSAQIMYPCMQCSGIFELKTEICQLGLDQRKVNMLAREYCDGLRMKHKPIILSHGMLPGLLEGQEKMSKSDPDSAIFMEDLSADVNRKIKKAFCPPQVLEGNPCMSYIEHMVFPMYGEFRVDRRDQDGVFRTVLRRLPGDTSRTMTMKDHADQKSAARHHGCSHHGQQQPWMVSSSTTKRRDGKERRLRTTKLTPADP